MTDNQIKRPSNEAIVCDCHRHNISCHMRTLEYDACGWRKTSPKNLWIFMKKCAKGGCCCCCTATIYGCYGCRSQTPDAFGYLFFLSFVLGDVCVCVHWICYCLLVECHYRNSEWFRHVNNFAVISAGIRGDSLLYTDAGLWKCNVQVACMCSSYSYALIAHKVNDVDSGVAKLYMRAEQTNSVCLLANKQLAHGDYHFFFAEVVRAGKWKSEAEKKLDNKTKIVNISVAVDGGCVARETIIKEEISSIGKLKMRAIDHNILWFFFISPRVLSTLCSITNLYIFEWANWSGLTQLNGFYLIYLIAMAMA